MLDAGQRVPGYPAAQAEAPPKQSQVGLPTGALACTACAPTRAPGPGAQAKSIPQNTQKSTANETIFRQTTSAFICRVCSESVYVSLNNSRSAEIPPRALLESMNIEQQKLEIERKEKDGNSQVASHIPASGTSRRGAYLRIMNVLLTSLLAINCSSCSSSSDVTTVTPAPVEAPIDEKKEETGVAQDTARYRGFRCSEIRLGISYSQFKKEALKKGIQMTEVDTNYPGLIRKFEINLAPPVKGMSWTPVAKFVDDGEAYRLFEIEGNITASDGSIVRKLSQKLGPSSFRGIQYKWVKHGTNVRLMQDNGRDALLFFTDDKTADIAGEKMAEAVDSGNYRH